MSQCIITGCRLVLTGEGKSLWGDLHLVGDNIYVFNGVIQLQRLAHWEYVYPDSMKDERQLLVKSAADYFERRGIVTIDRADANFNEAAQKYLGDQ